MSHVLIVDDEPSICWGFREFLSEEGHDVSIAASAEEALRLVEVKKPDAVVLDVRLPGMDGLTAIEKLRTHIDDTPIIVMTAFGNLETAVRAVQQGAFDYLPKPFDLDQAAAVVKRALETKPPKHPDTAAVDETDLGDPFIGSSPAMQNVFKQIALVSAADVPVLITGESGTGKELAARAIHGNSQRADGPFLPTCLAALSPSVVESELFGHVKGAFTGAAGDRTGLFQLASGGTVLLDEIGDTSNDLQVKLLRALEQQEITRVGDSIPRPIDVRVIAATNRSLPELISSGQFRDDLFFRLSVFQIRMPRLSERTDDIPALARHFLKRCRPKSGEYPIADDVLEELKKRSWPGNVRELRNVIEHAAIVSRGNPISCQHLPEPSVHTSPETVAPDDSLSKQIADWAKRRADTGDVNPSDAELYERFLALTEPPLLRAVLNHCNNNRAAAAEMLGMHRSTLRQKLRKYEID